MFRKIIVKKIAEILIVSLLITTMFSSCKSQDDTKNKDKIPQHNTSGELIYDEFDSENIMLLNNEIVYIRDVDKNFKFSFYSENEYDNVNILDSSENNFDNKVVHYDENYNYNMYLIDFMNDSYVEGMNYTIELPNYNDYFLIKDIEKTNTITFTIKTDVHDKTTFNNDLDLNKTYNNIDEVGDLKEGDIALIESDEEIVPYIMSEDG